MNTAIADPSSSSVSSKESRHVVIPKMNAIDRVVSFFDPGAALKRWKSRAALSFYNQVGRTTGYQTPHSARRSMRGWNPVSSSPDQDILWSQPASRAACRDLFMNSGLAAGALRRVRTNVVGSGLQLQSRIDREYLGMSDEEADRWEQDTEREFKLWAESKDCDVTRSMDFYEMQGLSLLSTLMNGDCFAALPFKPIPNSQMPYSLRVKLIEGDLVRNKIDHPDMGKIRGGIELDDDGAPVAYWVMKPHMYSGSYDYGEWTRVPAFGARSGRRNMIHLIERERVGQRRGMPMLANVIELLKQITRLTEAELMAAVVSSFFTVFVKREAGQDAGLMDMFDEESESILDKSGDSSSMGANPIKEDDNLFEMGPGIVNEMDEGQSIETADPSRPNDKFNDFFLSIVKQIGAAIEMPYEQLLMVFNSSYSASRGALLEAWKFYRIRRSWLAKNFCQPIYEEWLSEAVSIGRVGAPGFFDDPLVRKAWAGSLWVGQGQGQINPVDETKAALMRVQGYLSTYEDEYLSMTGGDWDQTVVRLARQNRKLERNGLTQPTTAKSNEDPETKVTKEAGGDTDE